MHIPLTSPASARTAHLRGQRLANAVVTAAIALAAAIEIVRAVVPPFELGALIAILVTIAGAAASVRYPWPGLAAVSLSTLIAGLTGWVPLVEWSCAVFVLFSVVNRRGRPLLGVVISAPPVAVGLAFEHDTSGGPYAVALGSVISIAAAAAIGYGLRTQWQYREILEQRAEDAVATREIEAERRVAEERLRIARDLHDVIGHEIAVVSMRIGVAEVSLPQGADEAREALAEARSGVQNVLTETQNVLALLRHADDAGSTEPTPGFETIPDLVESYRHLGLEVDDDLVMASEKIDAATGLTLYRVLQEALRNAHRYGRGTVRVSAETTDGQVRLDVSNTRELGQRRGGSGLGLVGMRERVLAAGGSMEVEDDGIVFDLAVRLPLGPGASA